ncbi:MAG TPA: Holliday junction resolvase RuvX, partial [Nitratifractor sp.]|nr:Holliday junction resolvase RuvX [Nitratifractor sp.]
MKLASVDIGLKRIGVAFCFDKKVVLPQNAIIRKGRNQAAKELSELLKEWGIDQLNVGLPKGGSSEEEMERRIKHFIS